MHYLLAFIEIFKSLNIYYAIPLNYECTYNNNANLIVANNIKPILLNFSSVC